MNFIHTGVPLLYVNEGICNPNAIQRSLPQQATHHKDQNSNQLLIAHIAIYHYLYCKSFEVKAYVQANTVNDSLHNSLVMNGGGVA